MDKSKLINTIFYGLKPLIPRRLQLWLRRKLILYKLPKYRNSWPILEKAGEKPPHFRGWPDGKKFAVVLTHDVELQKGHDRCKSLMALEQKHGFVSSFNFVPERYKVSSALRSNLEANGFEVGVHGLNHDGKLFQSRKIFVERAKKINEYIRDWKVVGFRAPAMHHNLDWIHDLHIDYDLSTFDTDPFEPQSDGVETIFPFWVAKNGKGYVELPYTVSQDFTPYVLMRKRTIDIWKKKVDWIVAKGGMVLVNVHPDYLAFDPNKVGMEEFPVKMYEELLMYVNKHYPGQFWNAIPRDVAEFWRNEVEPGDKNINN